MNYYGFGPQSILRILWLFNIKGKPFLGHRPKAIPKIGGTQNISSEVPQEDFDPNNANEMVQ